MKTGHCFLDSSSGDSFDY